MLKLNIRQKAVLGKVFSAKEFDEAKSFIEEEAGSAIPGCKDRTPEEMDRIRFAIIKKSQGDMSKLIDAIELANLDWRDLFMTAGFGDLDEHERWYDNLMDTKR